MIHVRMRVLVVDDSPRERAAVKRILTSDPDIEAVGSPLDYVTDPDRLARFAPDVVTLAREAASSHEGAAFRDIAYSLAIPLAIIQQRVRIDIASIDPVPGERGAPYLRQTLTPYAADSFESALIRQVKGLVAVGNSPTNLRAVTKIASVRSPFGNPIIAIGASTGGTQAITDVLRHFPANAPATLIVQHMPSGFTGSFARSLDRLMAMEVKEAEDGDEIVRGRVLVAPGGHHMAVVRDGHSLRVAIGDADPVNRHRPSVDVLFDSLARVAAPKTTAALLTGMGTDGAAGLERLHSAGAKTIAQDEQSCVVFGMPREAIRLNAADRVLPLAEIGDELIAIAERG